ncbi:MAG: Mre11 domain protein, partial [Akkermansiaceae bacterium]|nr:Mre11 domain protein [Akkermansiaceae bacterium]
FASKSAETVLHATLPVALHGQSFASRTVEKNLVPDYPQAIAGRFNLGLLHTSLAGAPGHDTYAPCSLEDLLSKGYDYWALGHVHQPAILNRDPWVVFPGNLQGRHIRETGARGCYLVTVDAALKVADCAWVTLDVARWAFLRVDLSGAESFEELHARTREVMAAAVEASEERLLAVRIAFTGVTALHGPLTSDIQRLHAEVEGCAEDFGTGRLWIERVLLETRPLVALRELAEQDALTRVVVESIEESKTGVRALPAEVESALAVLPPELAQRLSAEWLGEGWDALADDACAIVLERLTGGRAGPP